MTGASILIVEDEGILAIELKEKLEKLGYRDQYMQMKEDLKKA